MRKDHLISVNALQKRLDDPDLLILEATFFLPNQGRDAIAEFEADHIIGARYFDIDGVADLSSDLPHMLPSEKQFSEQMQALGINNNSKIVVYDRSPFLSSARCWWMFRLFGHQDIHVLDGGYQAWKDATGPIQSGSAEQAKLGNFITKPSAGAGHITLSELRDVIANKTSQQILDARPSARFTGEADEPRPGLSSGHMKGACNLPIMEILDENGFLKPENALKIAFTDAGIDLNSQIITTCGSGVTAAGLTLALATIGVDTVRLYDGSWTEWASQPDADIKKRVR